MEMSSHRRSRFSWTWLAGLVIALSQPMPYQLSLPTVIAFVSPSKGVARSLTAFDANHQRSHTLHSSAATPSEQKDDPYLPLWKLASAHCASQALHTVLQLEIPQFLAASRQNGSATLEEICVHVGLPPHRPNDTGTVWQRRTVLLRSLRLLTTVDILSEEVASRRGTTEEIRNDDDDDDGDGDDEALLLATQFALTPTGYLLVNGDDSSATPPSSSGMAFGIQHWMERPLWMSWLEVPNYIQQGDPLPFERANGGISSDFYYDREAHPESLQIANGFVQWVYQQEMGAVVDGYDWDTLVNKRLVDVGGHHGTVVKAIASTRPDMECIAFDLPQVIAAAPPPGLPNVELVGGNVLDASTIPHCDVVLLKHFLDRCMWTEEETVEILINCKSAVSERGGKVIIAEAVLPSIGQTSTTSRHGTIGRYHPTALHMDALYMLVGRERQRTQAEWERLAHRAGFEIQSIAHTVVPSCSLLVLGIL